MISDNTNNGIDIETDEFNWAMDADGIDFPVNGYTKYRWYFDGKYNPNVYIGTDTA